MGKAKQVVIDYKNRKVGENISVSYKGKELKDVVLSIKVLIPKEIPTNMKEFVEDAKKTNIEFKDIE